MAPLDPKLISHLSKHPRLALFDISIGMASTDLLLAEQKYKPEWIINASYGVRGKTAVGDERSDLFSMGVTIDIPVFSTSRQDSEVKAAITDREALKTERLLLLRDLYSRYGALYSDLEKLDKRHRLYEQQLLPGFSESAEAAINAYTVDDGSFAEVVRARISELDAKLTSLGIHVERLKTITAMNYLLTQVGDVEVTEQ
jgi:outer membrane protein TolC